MIDIHLPILLCDQSIKKISFIHFRGFKVSSFAPTVHQFPKHTLHHHYGSCYRRPFLCRFPLSPRPLAPRPIRINSPFSPIYTFFTLVIRRFISLVSRLTRRSNQYLTAQAFRRSKVLWFCSWKLLDWPPPLWEETYAKSWAQKPLSSPRSTQMSVNTETSMPCTIRLYLKNRSFARSIHLIFSHICIGKFIIRKCHFFIFIIYLYNFSTYFFLVILSEIWIYSWFCYVLIWDRFLYDGKERKNKIYK